MAYDGLGRLRQVIEDPSGKSYSTTYSYDPLDNLSSVTQGAQRRSFGYDGTGRLYLALNPESGTTTYSYDNAGNLSKKTDARNISSTYSYDALNRPTSIAYAGGTVSTPTVTYTYDAPNIPFSTGNLSSVSSSVSTTNYSAYDPLGRVTGSNRVTGSLTYNFGYTYNRAGSLTQESYPDGAQYLTQYDGANRITATGGPYPLSTVSHIAYAPHGAIQSYTLGNGVQRIFAYNARLQPEEITDVDTVHGYRCGGQATQYLSPPVTKWNLDLQLFWGSRATQNIANNGNLYRQTIQTCTGANLATPSNFLQTYTYDAVNRIAKVADSGANSARTFNYDQFGNMWSANTAGSFPSNMGTPTAKSNLSQTNNRLTTTTYDPAGNQLGIPAVCTNCLQYDAENRMVSYTPSGTTYTYDGNGQRVQKIANGVTTTYVYDAFGKLAAEYTSGTYPIPPCTLCYLSTDHLGSTRMVTDRNGALISLHDYLPFGEEINSGYAGRPSVNGAQDNTDQKFTGQLRDSESNLDYFNARYFAAALGRFISPDPANAGADPTNPQTWNAYAYVLGNPLANTDPAGMFASANPYPAGGNLGGIDPGACDLICSNGGVPHHAGLGTQYYSGPLTQGGGGGGGNNYTTTLPPRPSPPKNVARPDWLNNITSIFGYDQRIKLPSCAAIAFKTAADDLNPFLPAAADVAQGVLNVGQAVKFNQALTYAAGKGLTYPNKSSVFRRILNTSKMLGKVSDTLPLVNLDYALTDGLIAEIKAINQGQCQ